MSLFHGFLMGGCIYITVVLLLSGCSNVIVQFLSRVAKFDDKVPSHFCRRVSARCVLCLFFTKVSWKRLIHIVLLGHSVW